MWRSSSARLETSFWLLPRVPVRMALRGSALELTAGVRSAGVGDRCWGADGTVELTLRYGSRVLALAKGMDAVELASMDDLVGVLEQFKAAAERGEMDDMIPAQIANRKNKKAAKVAD